MRVYLAGRVSRLQELRGYADQLTEAGIEVTANWLYGPDDDNIHANRSGLSSEARATLAKRDMYDIRRADVCILFSESFGHNSAGNGRLVEFGYALGQHKECWVVGPLENLFLCLPSIPCFEKWEGALAFAKAFVKDTKEDLSFKDAWKNPHPRLDRNSQQGEPARSDAATPGVVLGTGHPVQ